MYKTIYQLDVYIKGDTDPTPIDEAVSVIALNQIKAGRDIDIQVADDEETFNAITPYHAIEYVIVESARQQVSDPVDDNCIVDGGDEPVEPGTLKITNASGDDLTDIAVFASGSVLDGVYGDLTFDGSVATIASLADGASVTATGIPNGTDISVQSHAGTNHGTVPVLITIGGGHVPK